MDTPTLNGQRADHWFDRTGRALDDAGQTSRELTDRMVRLAAADLADRAVRTARKPGVVRRAWRWLAGSDRPRLPVRTGPDRTERTRTADRTGLAPVPVWMSWLGVWVDRTFGGLPLLAPLVLSGWYTAHVGHDMLNLPWAAAVLLTIAAEGGVWRLARLLEKTLVAGDSTLGIRVGIAAYLLAIGGLIFLHAVTSQTGWTRLLTGELAGLDWTRTWPAFAVSCLSLAGVYIWGREARWKRRAELRAAGRIDAQLIRFSVWRWIFCFAETLATTRYAVKHSIEVPADALEARRTERSGRRTFWEQTAPRTAEQVAAESDDGPDPDAEADRTLADADRAFTEQTVRTERRTAGPDRTADVADLGTDADLIAKVRTVHRTGPVTGAQVRSVIGGGKSRAYRIAKLMEMA